jgi:hypothetical protein
MRTSKRWTNATFTKRVDHEAGKHRGPAALKGSRICRGCGAVYAKRRWTLATPPAARTLRAIPRSELVLCPACRMAAEGQFGGEVRLSGGFVAGHRAEIERLIRNEARRAAEDNPLARILQLDRAVGGLTVRTTTEHLAQRIGDALRKALHGQVQYQFSHENKFAHVRWSRDS